MSDQLLADAVFITAKRILCGRETWGVGGVFELHNFSGRVRDETSKRACQEQNTDRPVRGSLLCSVTRVMATLLCKRIFHTN
jgi:hypothetical protein